MKSAAARAAARARWQKLPANLRRILISHRPTEFEREEQLRHSTMTALSNVFGPRAYGPEAARQAEPDEEGVIETEPLYACTSQEIATEMQLSRASVQKIERRALRRLKIALENIEKDRVRALSLAEHTGLTFHEALLLVENQADGKLWAIIDEPRRVQQATRDAAAALEATKKKERDREQKRKQAEEEKKAYWEKGPTPNDSRVIASFPLRPAYVALYAGYLAGHYGPHGPGCTCPYRTPAPTPTPTSTPAPNAFFPVYFRHTTKRSK